MNNENRFYVYVHRLKETGEVFYAGKGTGSRMRSQHGRSAAWYDITSKNEWFFEIKTDNLCEKDAIEQELLLIKELSPEANVHLKDISARPVRAEDFCKRYYYDETSPSGLRYLVGNNQHGKKKRLAGDVAGTLLRSGYYTVSYEYSNYFAHRVVWCLVNATSIQEELIDHIDRNRSNNRIENLRIATRSENNKNASTKSHNTTGFIGVTHCKEEGFYISTWVDDSGKKSVKPFSIAKHGEELALALAVDYRHVVTKDLRTYITDETYRQPVILDSFSEDEKQAMFKCDLMVTNKSGFNGVHFAKIRNNSFWCYSSYRNKTVRFSCTKHGDVVAKTLAIEYKDYVEKTLMFDSLSKLLREEIENPVRANNATGITGISFIGSNKDSVLMQVMINYKNYTKTFNTRTLGLIPAIYAAFEWKTEVIKTIKNRD